MAAAARRQSARAASAVVLLLGAIAAAEPTASVVLRWAAVEGASEYEVEIARDGAFQDVTVRARVPMPAYRWREIPAQVYFWRVRSLDGETRSSPWSEVRQILPASRTPALMTTDGQRIRCAPHCEAELRFERNPVMKRYLVALARGPDFKDELPSRSVAAPPARVRLTDAGRWYWRVRGVDFSGRETDWSEARSVIAVPGAPEVIAPADGATVAAGSGSPPTVGLSWSSEASMASFNVEVRDVVGKVTRLSSGAASLSFPAPSPGAFSWRVRVGADGEWTRWNGFEVLPTAPRLTAPEPSAKVIARAGEVEIPFAWETGLAAGYRIEVSAGDRFDNSAHTERASGNSATLRLAPGYYLWRVIAESGQGVETASEVRPLAVVSYAPLPAPAPISPPRGAVIRQGAVALAWSPIAEAAQYELSLRRPGSKEPEVLRTSTPGTSFQPADDGDYEWRVRALEANGAPGAWSSETLFKRGLPRIAQAVFRPGSRWSVDAGSEVTPFEVDLYDAGGRPVEGATLAAESDLGAVVPLGEEGGTYRFAFLAPEHVSGATVAEIRVGERDFASTARVDVRPPHRFRLSARAGFATNFGALAGPWAGAELAVKAPLVRRAWILGRVGTFGGTMQIPPSVGLDAPLRADARVVSTSVLVAYEWSAPSGTLQVGAGPALHFAHVETNRESAAMWDAGLELTMGIARRWGPGKALVQATFALGTAEGTLARLRTGGLVVAVGYGWEP